MSREIKCKYCEWEPDGNKGEFLWTSDEGKMICTDCLVERTGKSPKGLKELNEERQKQEQS